MADTIEKVITPDFRAAFISVFKATAMKQNDGTMGAAKYSIKAVFPPTANLSVLKEQARAAAAAKWGSNVPKSLRSPFRTNSQLDNPVMGLGDDWVVVTFSSPGDRMKPGLVDQRNQTIINEEEVYSGAWYRAQVRAYAYDTAGNKGVSFGLENVQKVRDDEPLGGGRTPANKAFEPVTNSDGAPADDPFA